MKEWQADEVYRADTEYEMERADRLACDYPEAAKRLKEADEAVDKVIELIELAADKIQRSPESYKLSSIEDAIDGLGTEIRIVMHDCVERSED